MNYKWTQSLIFIIKNKDDQRSEIKLCSITARTTENSSSSQRVIRAVAFLPAVFFEDHPDVVGPFKKSNILIARNEDDSCALMRNGLWDAIEINLDKNPLAEVDTLTITLTSNESDNGRCKGDLEWIFQKTSLNIQRKCPLQTALYVQSAIDSKNCDVFNRILGFEFVIQYSIIMPWEIGSLLTVSTKREQKYLVQLLLDHGTDVNSISSAGRTPLHWAVRNGAFILVQILVKYGAYVNKKDTNGWTPLHFAASQGHLEIAKFLFLNGADTDPRANDDRTPLHWAAQNGLVALTNFFLSEEANVNATDECGYTPLHLATKQEHVEVMELLLQNGAHINAKCIDHGYTALHQLAYQWTCPQSAVVQLLVERGAAVDVKDDLGNTPLQAAVTNKKESWVGVVQLLIKGGANISAVDGGGRTPLQNSGSFEMMKVLIENGADPNEVDSSQLKSFFETVGDEGLNRIKVWLDHGVCIEKNFYGKSILEWVYQYGQLSTVAFKYILERCFVDPARLMETKIHEILFHPTFDLHYYIGMSDTNMYCRSVVCSQPYIHHLVKIMSLKLYKFHEVNIESIWHWSGETFSEFKEKCEAEVYKIKNHSIPGTYLSMLGVLSKSENEVACLLRNPSVVAIINPDNIRMSYPVYGNILAYHIEKGLNRRSFQKQGIYSFSQLSCNLKKLPFEIKDNIVSCLSVYDILNVRRACNRPMAAKWRD